MKIGVLSDTHGFLDKKLFTFFKECNEIWHAGDIGSAEVLKQLSNYKPLIAVYGNIDGHEIRAQLPVSQRLVREGKMIWMTHIGGYPGNYDPRIKDALTADPPEIFISGHSHILKIIPDKKYNLLHINPGAAGRHGLHKIRTAVRFDIENKRITNFEIIELGQRSKKFQKDN